MSSPLSAHCLTLSPPLTPPPPPPPPPAQRYSAELQKKEFGDLIIFLQHLPTQGWSEKEVGELLAQAFVYKTRYSQAHLTLS